MYKDQDQQFEFVWKSLTTFCKTLAASLPRIPVDACFSRHCNPVAFRHFRFFIPYHEKFRPGIERLSLVPLQIYTDQC